MTIPQQIVEGNYKYVTHPSQLVQGMVLEFDNGKCWREVEVDWGEWEYKKVVKDIEQGAFRIPLLTEEQLAGIEVVEKCEHHSRMYEQVWDYYFESDGGGYYLALWGDGALTIDKEATDNCPARIMEFYNLTLLETINLLSNLA